MDEEEENNVDESDEEVVFGSFLAIVFFRPFVFFAPGPAETKDH